MMDFKGQSPDPRSDRGHDWLAEFDFLRILVDFFAAVWITDRMAPRPVPVRVRERR
jgi:hypothetical protein